MTFFNKVNDKSYGNQGFVHIALNVNLNCESCSNFKCTTSWHIQFEIHFNAISFDEIKFDFYI